MRVLEPFLTEEVFKAGRNDAEVPVSEYLGDLIKIFGVEFRVKQNSKRGTLVFHAVEGDAFIEIVARYQGNHNITFQNVSVPYRAFYQETLFEKDETVTLSGSWEKGFVVTHTQITGIQRSHLHHIQEYTGPRTSLLSTTERKGFLTFRRLEEFQTIRNGGKFITIPRNPFHNDLIPWLVQAHVVVSKPGVSTFEFYFNKEGFVVDCTEPYIVVSTFTAITTHSEEGAVVQFEQNGNTILEANFRRVVDTFEEYRLHGPLEFKLDHDPVFSREARLMYAYGKLEGLQYLKLDNETSTQVFEGEMYRGRLCARWNDLPSLTHTETRKHSKITEVVQQWMEGGVLHRENKPAIEQRKTDPRGPWEPNWAYFRRGLAHRTNGPQHKSWSSYYSNGEYAGSPYIKPIPRKEILTHLPEWKAHIEATTKTLPTTVEFDRFFGQRVYYCHGQYEKNVIWISDLWGTPLARIREGSLQWMCCCPNIENVQNLFFRKGSWTVRFEDGTTKIIHAAPVETPPLLSHALSTVPLYALYRTATEGLSASLGIHHPVLKELLGMTLPVLLNTISTSDDTQAKCEAMLTLALHRGGRSLLDAVSHNIFSRPECLEAFETLPSKVLELTGDDDFLEFVESIEIPAHDTDPKPVG